MPKIKERDRCQIDPRNPLIVCTIHPTEADSDRCLDFQPPAEPEELWAAEGLRFVKEGNIAKLLPGAK
jgi:hypothetical protein